MSGVARALRRPQSGVPEIKHLNVKIPFSAWVELKRRLLPLNEEVSTYVRKMILADVGMKENGPSRD
jgi:hypothetical protein